MDYQHALCLAGGASRRFGRDKASIRWRGRPLIEWVAHRLQAGGFRVTIAGGAAADPAPPSCARIPDLFPGEGPLPAIYGALLRLPYRRTLIVAVDMPLLPIAVMRCLWEAGSNAALTCLAGSPLPAVYDRVLLSHLHDLVHSGERRLRAVALHVSRLGVVEIPTAKWRAIDPAGHAHSNMNRPADWEVIRHGIAW